MRPFTVVSAIRTVARSSWSSRLPWNAQQPHGIATATASVALQPLTNHRTAFAIPPANLFATAFANRRLALSSDLRSRILMSSVDRAFPQHATNYAADHGGGFSTARSVAQHPSAHVSQADESKISEPAKAAAAGNPTSTKENVEMAKKVPGKRFVGRMEGSDPLALLKALAPMQVILGAGMLTALLLPRPLALALTAAALLPPIFRTLLHSWRWNRQVKMGGKGKASGGSGEEKKDGGLEGEGGAEREGLLGKVVSTADAAGQVVGGENRVATAAGDSKPGRLDGKQDKSGGRLGGNVLSVNGMDIFKGKMAGKMDGDFCLFLIGARANHPWPLGASFASIGEVFGKAVRELEEQSDKFGFLGGDYYVGTDVTRGSQTLAVMFWRSYDHLVRYAQDQNQVHGAAWKRMNELLRESPDIGVWHEAYAVNAGQYESVYINCPQFGLGAAGKLVPAVGPLGSSRGRMRDGGNVNGGEGGEMKKNSPKKEKGDVIRRQGGLGKGRCPMGL